MRSLIVLLMLASTAQAGYPYYCYPRTYTTYVQPVVAVPTPAEPGWRTHVINALYQKTKLAADSADYALALQALAPGAVTGYAPGPVAAQGTTAYGEYSRGGYSQNPLQLYQQTNLETLFAMSNRQTENAQQLSGQAHGGFLAAVKEASAGNERVATILAKVELLKAAEPPEFKRVGQQTTAQSGYPSPPPNPYPQQRPPVVGGAGGLSPGMAALGRLMSAKCLTCHSGETVKGGIDLSRYPEFDDEAKARVRATIDWASQPNPDLRMPRAADGGEGEELTFREKLLFAN